jgi:3-deoxy-D-manno-octulosonic-acid transferase
MCYFVTSSQYMTLLYRIALSVFYGLLFLVSPFNRKARQWITGRYGWKAVLKNWNPESNPVVWVHAASLGEFEQGRPLIEAIRQLRPGHRILLTFYSPSGFEIRKNYPGADLVMYLPLDGPSNARIFIKYAKPATALFIKYEYWYFILKALSEAGIPVHMISPIFRPSQAFFKWYGAWFRRKLGFITSFFVQDEASGQLLESVGITRYRVTGDTRFDRVASVVAAAKEIPLAAAFAGDDPCLVAGSTWPGDEDVLLHYIHQGPDTWKYIIAPHEIGPANLNGLTSKLRCNYLLFSQATEESVRQCRVLVIDNIGMLSSLYRYGKVAYIGGGFGKGIHNILEAAAYGIPVIFGPRYNKFREACELVRLGGAFPVKQEEDLAAIMERLADAGTYTHASRIAGNYVSENTGATQKITSALFPASDRTNTPS